MKDQHKKSSYIILLLVIFGIIGAMFCYFLGTTETWTEAFGAFWTHGRGMLPMFLAVVCLIVLDVRRMNRGKKQ